MCTNILKVIRIERKKRNEVDRHVHLCTIYASMFTTWV